MIVPFAPVAMADTVDHPVAAAMSRALKQSVVENRSGAGSPILYLDAPQLRRFWNEDAKKVIDAVRAIGKIDQISVCLARAKRERRRRAASSMPPTIDYMVTLHCARHATGRS